MILTDEQIEKWNNNKLFIRFEDDFTIEEINYVLKHEFYNVNPNMISRTLQAFINPIGENSNVFLICKLGYGTISNGYKIGNENNFDFVFYKKVKTVSILENIIKKLENYEKFKT